jgi:hypothetical protein
VSCAFKPVLSQQAEVDEAEEKSGVHDRQTGADGPTASQSVRSRVQSDGDMFTFHAPFLVTPSSRQSTGDGFSSGFVFSTSASPVSVESAESADASQFPDQYRLAASKPIRRASVLPDEYQSWESSTLRAHADASESEGNGSQRSRPPLSLVCEDNDDNDVTVEFDSFDGEERGDAADRLKRGYDCLSQHLLGSVDSLIPSSPKRTRRVGDAQGNDREVHLRKK